MKWMADKIP